MQKVTEVKKVLFKKEDIVGISHYLQLSNTATKILSRDIRVVTGNRKSIEPHTRDGINETNHQLDDFFEMCQLTYRREDKQTKLSEHFKQPTVVCEDLTALVEEILRKMEREEVDSLLINISIDGGGGFLKICLSIFDINDPLPKANSAMSKNRESRKFSLSNLFPMLVKIMSMLRGFG